MKRLLQIIPLLLFVSCQIGPKPITYGLESCHYCSMTVVDQQHAAQLVTKKGKTYTFDSSECMINHLKEREQAEVALVLANDYNAPGKLIDATKATYLISDGIPSPMGEFLTAFASKEDAESTQEAHSGKLYTWQALLIKFNTEHVHDK